MSTASDYINRRFDLLALHGARPVGEVQLRQSIFDATTGGEICAGIQKVAQEWTIRFLTVQGSKKFATEDGCNFLAIARRGGFRTEADVRAEFNFGSAKVRQQMVRKITDAMPLDERLASAVLTRVYIAPEILQLYVSITSQAGDAREVLLPIPYLPIATTI